MKNRRDRYVVVNYNHDSDHFKDTLNKGTIGIPDRKHTSGRRILDKASSKEPIYGVLYDARSRNVRGFFTTLGDAYHSSKDQKMFKGANVENNWGHRIKAMVYISPKNVIPANDFKAMGGKLRKGSMTVIPEKTWIKVKQQLTSPEA